MASREPENGLRPVAGAGAGGEDAGGGPPSPFASTPADAWQVALFRKIVERLKSLPPEARDIYVGYSEYDAFGVAQHGRVPIVLPPPPPAAAARTLTPTQEKILEVLRESPVPLTRKAVSVRLGYKGRTTGKFGAAVRDLVKPSAQGGWGLLFVHGDEVTDDPAKFPPVN